MTHQHHEAFEYGGGGSPDILTVDAEQRELRAREPARPASRPSQEEIDSTAKRLGARIDAAVKASRS